MRQLQWIVLVAAALVAASLNGVFADAPQPIVKVDFATTDAGAILSPSDAAAATLTSQPDELPPGAKRAMIGDSQASNAEWNEFLRSRTDVFKPGSAYKVEFDYRILGSTPVTGFYMLFRREGDASKSQGWLDLKTDTGQTGHALSNLVTHDAADYRLIIGIHYHGKISISNITITQTPLIAVPVLYLPHPNYTWTATPSTYYYIDSGQGSDTNPGTSPAQAWKTLDKANTGTFMPGDRILLKRGGTWTGYLAPAGNGEEGQPILLTSYGPVKEPNPSIDAGGKWLATIYLHNTEYWTVRDLDISNKGSVPQPRLTGVEVKLDDFGTSHQTRLIDLNIHDVTGSDVKDDGGGAGIECQAGGSTTPSRFDGLLIQGCHITHTDRNGIVMGGNWQRNSWFPHLHVVISHNVLTSIGGDGIVPIACDGALVDHNTIVGAHLRCTDYAAGIWPWSCDNTVLEYNDVSGMRGRTDGEAYDSDWNCRNTLFQYNYSHDNEGGFMLICDDGSVHPPISDGNDGTIIRYNISVGDRDRWFCISGPVSHTQIYNNTIVTLPGEAVKPIDAGNWGGAYPSDTAFTNNIFYDLAQAAFDLKGMTNATFDHNDYYGSLSNKPADPADLTVDPAFTTKTTPSSAEDCSLSSHSPLIGAGAPIPNSGARTYANHPIKTPNPDIGAF